MSKLLAVIVAAMFAVVTVGAFADKHVKKEDPLAAACKGKKAGDEVTVADKKVKCPEVKAEKK